MKLEEFLEERRQTIDAGLELLRETREIFDQYGSEHLKSSHEKFARLETSLNARELRMVVVGEFSRGKSSLLNALLGIRHLPTASEATTAINTFIHGLPPNAPRPYLEIHFQNRDDTQKVEFEAGDTSPLEKWGTELERDNRDARKEVDRIDFYIRHPLLDRNLVLIDTPGLQSLQKHHEMITHKAIDDAHIAICVMNATQLGGTDSEWSFMRDTLSRNFNKFLTVVTWWDKVYEPEDEHERRWPEEKRVARKLEIVRDNFRRGIPDMDEERFRIVTSDANLFGVSSKWALDGNPEQKKKSGIGKLSQRIAEIINSPEERGEICRKPMTQLGQEQEKFLDHLKDRLGELENSDTLEKRKSQLDLLKADINSLELEIKNLNNESQLEHNRLAEVSIGIIKKELLEPLRDMKEKIELLVTPEYVQREIDAHKKTIGLPPQMQEAYSELTKSINEKWEDERENIAKRLEQLRLEYANAMNRHVGDINSSLQTMNMDLPDMDVDFHPDISALEAFYQQKMAIEKEIDQLEEKQAEIERKKQLGEIELKDFEGKLEEARKALERAETRLLQHGERPLPITRYRREKVSEGGLWSSDKFEDVPYQDESAVEHWDELREEYAALLNDREAALEQIMDEMRQQKRANYTEAQALREYERRLEKAQAKMEKMEREMGEKSKRISADARETLLKATAGQLDKLICQLEHTANESVRKIFVEHQQYLAQCVEEAYTEQLRGKEAARQETIETIEKGEMERENRKNELAEAIARLQKVMEKTQALLGENN